MNLSPPPPPPLLIKTKLDVKFSSRSRDSWHGGAGDRGDSGVYSAALVSPHPTPRRRLFPALGFPRSRLTPGFPCTSPSFPAPSLVPINLCFVLFQLFPQHEALVSSPRPDRRLAPGPSGRKGRLHVPGVGGSTSPCSRTRLRQAPRSRCHSDVRRGGHPGSRASAPEGPGEEARSAPGWGRRAALPHVCGWARSRESGQED